MTEPLYSSPSTISRPDTDWAFTWTPLPCGSRTVTSPETVDAVTLDVPEVDVQRHGAGDGVGLHEAQLAGRGELARDGVQLEVATVVADDDLARTRSWRRGVRACRP